MRKTILFAAAAGLTVGCLGTSGASAMTSTSPAGMRVATEAMDSSALVHCRPYRHWHSWEHRWTHGCHRGVGVEADVVIRHGHRVRVHEGVSSRTTVRSGTSTTTRGEVTTKSGTSTTTKSGTSTGDTGRAQSGAKSSTGGSTSGGAGGSIGGAGTSGGQSGGPKQ